MRTDTDMEAIHYMEPLLRISYVAPHVASPIVETVGSNGDPDCWREAIPL